MTEGCLTAGAISEIQTPLIIPYPRGQAFWGLQQAVISGWVRFAYLHRQEQQHFFVNVQAVVEFLRKRKQPGRNHRVSYQ